MNYTPKKIIYNGKATVVFWADGSKTVVKCAEDTKFDKYNGFCAALAKKVYGTNNHLKKCIERAENAKRYSTSDETPFAENAKRYSTKKNKAGLKVGDRVRVLDGSKIPNYTQGWSMNHNIGRVATIDLITEFSDGRKGAQLSGINSSCTYDLRGLEKVQAV